MYHIFAKASKGSVEQRIFQKIDKDGLSNSLDEFIDNIMTRSKQALFYDVAMVKTKKEFICKEVVTLKFEICITVFSRK